jgi:DNA-binding beta-propeller fold protein YncE
LVTTTVVVALCAGCSSGTSQDGLQVAAQVVAATPAVSPPASAPAGTVLPPAPGLGSAGWRAADVSAMVVDNTTRTLAVAVTKPPQLWLYSLDNLTVAPRTVDLPGPVSQLSLAKAGGPVLAPVSAANQVVQVALPTGATTMVPVPGGPTSAAVVGGQLLVAVPGRRVVDVVSGGQVVRGISGNAEPDQVLAVGGRGAVLDRPSSALYDLDLSGGIGAGLRAGDGATNAVTDEYGRVLVTDTRGGELLAFTANAMVLRQRYPLPGAPYGIAYDPKRDLAWVTLTARNQVVGFDMAGGSPVERYRLPTVRQPNSVAVDPDSGRVFVASADGEGVCVIQP